MAKNQEYPSWVCWDCGIKAQSDKGRIFEFPTYHTGVCGVCNERTAVTEPRGFGYPEFEDVRCEKQEG